MRNPGLERVGFYSRQRIGLGTFITRAIIEQRYPTAIRVAELIQQVPGIFRVDEGDNESVIYVRLHPRFDGPCPATLYVDGLFFQKRLPRIAAQDIEAIEIYRGAAQVPAQYGGVNAACGVIVIWTRTGAGG
jgi:outer membrane cobalamin receptor